MIKRDPWMTHTSSLRAPADISSTTLIYIAHLWTLIEVRMHGLFWRVTVNLVCDSLEIMHSCTNELLLTASGWMFKGTIYVISMYVCTNKSQSVASHIARDARAFDKINCIWTLIFCGYGRVNVNLIRIFCMPSIECWHPKKRFGSRIHLRLRVKGCNMSLEEGNLPKMLKATIVRISIRKT